MVWTHRLVITTLPVSVIAFVALSYIKTHAKEPNMPDKFIPQVLALKGIANSGAPARLFRRGYGVYNRRS